jgi:hypothetical protein
MSHLVPHNVAAVDAAEWDRLVGFLFFVLLISIPAAKTFGMHSVDFALFMLVLTAVRPR